jgi:hypothetical protein
MAFTTTVVKKSVVGDMRMHILSCSAGTATEANIETGLNNVLGFTITPVSMTSATELSSFRNIGSTATALAGYIGVSGMTATDEFQVICWGN